MLTAKRAGARVAWALRRSSARASTQATTKESYSFNSCLRYILLVCKPIRLYFLSQLHQYRRILKGRCVLRNLLPLGNRAQQAPHDFAAMDLGYRLRGELERLRRVDRFSQAQLEKYCIVGNHGGIM
jgi:hypothetical protein